MLLETIRADALPTLFFAALLVVVALHALYWLLVGLIQPIADLHQFRQTQTALTAYWMWNGGPLLAYETPALGSSWSIPFELPVYQWLLSGFRLVGVPLNIGGRLISFAFYLGLLWPLRMLITSLGLGDIDYLIIAILLFSSPLYLYWSRTVMIESCALFFAIAWLAFLVQFLRSGAWQDAMIATIYGVVAINTKVTTFVTFGLIGGVAFLGVATQVSHPLFLIEGAAAGLIPLATALVWIAYTDRLKLTNFLASTTLTSASLTRWNFGTWAQRFSYQFWLNALMGRIIPDVLGYASVPALIVAGAALLFQEHASILAVLVFGFLMPMLLFINLHIEHNYYQYANALFLLAVVGLGLASIAHAGSPILSAVLTVLVVAGQITFFYKRFAKVIVANYSANRQVLAGALVRKLTRPNESVLVFGDDWSSAIAFESERKTLTLPYWASADAINKILENPADYLGETPLGGIVIFPSRMRFYSGNQQSIERFASGRKVLGKAADCLFLAPDRIVITRPPEMGRNVRRPDLSLPQTSSAR